MTSKFPSFSVAVTNTAGKKGLGANYPNSPFCPALSPLSFSLIYYLPFSHTCITLSTYPFFLRSLFYSSMSIATLAANEPLQLWEISLGCSAANFLSFSLCVRACVFLFFFFSLITRVVRKVEAAEIQPRTNILKNTRKKWNSWRLVPDMH